MGDRVWAYRTQNFEFFCEEECAFSDPMSLGDFVSDVVNDGLAHHIRLRAEVWLKHGTVVGRASKSSIVQPVETGEFVDHVVFDHSDRREVVRWAIENAREELGPMVNGLPGIRLRPSKANLDF